MYDCEAFVFYMKVDIIIIDNMERETLQSYFKKLADNVEFYTE